jgi:hypothetical protein
MPRSRTEDPAMQYRRRLSELLVKTDFRIPRKVQNALKILSPVGSANRVEHPGTSTQEYLALVTARSWLKSLPSAEKQLQAVQYIVAMQIEPAVFKNPRTGRVPSVPAQTRTSPGDSAMLIVDGLLVGFEKTPQLKEVGSDLRRAGEKLIEDGIRAGVLPPAEEVEDVRQNSGSAKFSLDSGLRDSAIERGTQASMAEWSQELSMRILSMISRRMPADASPSFGDSTLATSNLTIDGSVSARSDPTAERGRPGSAASSAISLLHKLLALGEERKPTIGAANSVASSVGTEDGRGPGS